MLRFWSSEAGRGRQRGRFVSGTKCRCDLQQNFAMNSFAAIVLLVVLLVLAFLWLYSD
jgi:hypothetical protein